MSIHLLLDVYGTLDSFNYTRELSKKAVPHQFDQTPLPLDDVRLNELFSQSLETLQRVRFICTHETCVVNYIGCEYCGKTALQDCSPFWEKLTVDEIGIYVHPETMDDCERPSLPKVQWQVSTVKRMSSVRLECPRRGKIVIQSRPAARSFLVHSGQTDRLV